MTAPPRETEKGSGWTFGALLVFVLLLVAYCSKQQSHVADLNSQADALASDTINVAEPVADEAPLPLDRSAMIRGAKQLQLVGALDLPGTRQIFSQNCYDALAKSFDWHQLDRCGEFDAMAVRLAEVAPNMTKPELDYFQSENAATRYLGAATGHGLIGGDADIRWAALEAGAQGFRLPIRKIEAEPTETEAPASQVSSPPLTNAFNVSDENVSVETERSD